jgi:hypothetical protein
MRVDVAFASEGVTCRGWLSVPDDVVLPVGHFDPYESPCFADAAGTAVEWFTTHLGPTGRARP